MEQRSDQLSKPDDKEIREATERLLTTIRRIQPNIYRHIIGLIKAFST